jgi:hypothetical protein
MSPRVSGRECVIFAAKQNQRERGWARGFLPPTPRSGCKRLRISISSSVSISSIHPSLTPQASCRCSLAHVADGHLGDAGVGRLQAGEDDGFAYVFGVHHVGVADGVLGSASAEGELGPGAAGADGPDVEVVPAEFGVEGLGESYLGEFAGAVDGLSGVALQAGDGGDEEDDATLLGNERRSCVAGEEEAGLHVGVHELVVLFGGGVDEVQQF